MSLSTLLIIVIAAYFALLLVISNRTSKGASNKDFFIANRKSPWYLVAFGMVGATLSGVTFMSVPGWVAASEFSYMQMVAGYFIGYMLIATVLMPVYYRLGLTSIYTYLDQRFGVASYKTGAAFFLLSRIVGAAFRLYLVAIVFHTFISAPAGVPFWATVLITIMLIYLYTFRGGIKTIVFTDTLQTTFMLLAVTLTVFVLKNQLGWDWAELFSTINSSKYSQIFFFKGGWADSKNFFKLFFSGAAIALVMTGLDQDMMQKNLSCRSLKDAQKNMFSFCIVLFFANLLFLVLGALLYIYADQMGIALPESSDLLFPEIALNHLPQWVGVIFILGLVAAAYSSADSALTALTTSVCIDFLDFKEQESTSKSLRMIVHVSISVALFLVILIFWWINDRAVIDALFTFACYTYGPLLGLFAYGLLNKRAIHDAWVPVVCIAAPILTYFIGRYDQELFFGYNFGYELLIINGLITFIGLGVLSRIRSQKQLMLGKEH